MYDPAADPSHAYIVGRGTWFGFYVDPSIPLREAQRALGPQASLDAVGDRYAALVEEAIGDTIAPLTVRARPWRGPRTGGPIPDQQELVQLIGIATDIAGRLVDIAALAVLVKAAKGRLETLTRREVVVRDGTAMILAADAIFAETGNGELSLAFVTRLNAHTKNRGDFDSWHAGYLVGFRDDHHLHLATVDDYGNVTVLVDDGLPVG